MNHLTFLDELPGGVRHGRVDWEAIAHELDNHSGKWAEIQRFPAANSRRYQSRGAGARAALSRHGRFEVTQRTVGDDLVIYARAVSA